MPGPSTSARVLGALVLWSAFVAPGPGVASAHATQSKPPSTSAVRPASSVVRTKSRLKARVLDIATRTTLATILLPALGPGLVATVGHVVAPPAQRIVLSATEQPANADGPLGAVVWTTTKGGTLFGSGPKASDVQQSIDMGDCAWMSAFAAEAKSNPDVIRNAITPSAGGKFAVRLFTPPPSQNVTVRVNGTLVGAPDAPPKVSEPDLKVEIDAALPMYRSWIARFFRTLGASRYKLEQPAFARGADPQQLWVPLLEKGVARAIGGTSGYDRLQQGDTSALPLSALSGKPSRVLAVPGASAQGTFLAIQKATESHTAMVAGTLDGDTWQKLSLPLLLGLQTHHGYSVMGTAVVHGQEYVILRNPMGYRTQFLPFSAAEFPLKLQTFMTTFKDVAFN